MVFCKPKKYFWGVISFPGITPFTAESKVLYLRWLEKELNVSSIKLEGTATIIKSHVFKAVSKLVVISIFLRFSSQFVKYFVFLFLFLI